MGGSISAMFGDNGRMSWKDVLVAIIAWAVLLLIIFLIFYIFYRIRQK
jgi:high-affinity Fe2+/Pb2+ permease